MANFLHYLYENLVYKPKQTYPAKTKWKRGLDELDQNFTGKFDWNYISNAG